MRQIVNNDRIVQCNGFKEKLCLSCSHNNSCWVNGKLELMMNIEIDRIYIKEKVVFT